MRLTFESGEQTIHVEINQRNEPQTLKVEHLDSQMILRIHEIINNPKINILVYMARQGMLTSNTYGFRTYNTDVQYIEGSLEKMVKYAYEIIMVHDVPANTVHAIITTDQTETIITGSDISGTFNI